MGMGGRMPMPIMPIPGSPPPPIIIGDLRPVRGRTERYASTAAHGDGGTGTSSGASSSSSSSSNRVHPSRSGATADSQPEPKADWKQSYSNKTREPHASYNQNAAVHRWREPKPSRQQQPLPTGSANPGTALHAQGQLVFATGQRTQLPQAESWYAYPAPSKPGLPMHEFIEWLDGIKKDRAAAAVEQRVRRPKPASARRAPGTGPELDIETGTAAETLSALLPQGPGDKLRPLSSRPQAWSDTSSERPFRDDPKLFPRALHAFHRASSQLRMTTQLPAAAAEYVVAAAPRGALDLGRHDVSLCRTMLAFMADAQVLNRTCLEQVGRALQPHWAELRPAELLQVLDSLRRLNDAGRLAGVGRPGFSSSRLLPMLLYGAAEPCVQELLLRLDGGGGRGGGGGGGGGGEGDGGGAGGGGGGIAGAGAGADAGGSSGGSGGGAGDRSSRSSAGGGLPPGAAMLLSRAYLSFYLSAASGQQFNVKQQLLDTLVGCLARLQPRLGDPRAAPADELARLVAGLSVVAAHLPHLPGHRLAEPLRACAVAVVERAGELSQSARALLLDLPPRHWALPPGWRDTLLSTAPLPLAQDGVPGHGALAGGMPTLGAPACSARAGGVPPGT
ncbi:hypothetical protein TSOC_006365 [Tetrabaena socialis]|uniref:Uncharacterized protein n=1 Tax=Tetrabaena socialis TaxID=47790 RepID=A0A2J8A3W6_9CHLO|nr:hypothetical protein TSOC_006365 [Tetrabaena socialis]|eukprot:PNH07204.1 hypothetical protein TSOC_006365 [Tetrabaena socialis]